MRSVLSNKVVLFIIAILLLANIVMLAFFLWFNEPVKVPHPEGSRAIIAKFLEAEIGFDRGQMQKYQSLRDLHRKTMRPLFEDMRLTKISFFSLLHTPDVEDSAIHRGAFLIGEKQRRIDLQTFRNFQELRKLCRPEQKEKYDALVPGMINKMWFAPKDSSRLKEAKRK